MNTVPNASTTELRLGRSDSTRPVWPRPTTPPADFTVANALLDGFARLFTMLEKPSPAPGEGQRLAAVSTHENAVQRRLRRLLRELSEKLGRRAKTTTAR